MGREVLRLSPLRGKLRMTRWYGVPSLRSRARVGEAYCVSRGRGTWRKDAAWNARLKMDSCLRGIRPAQIRGLIRRAGNLAWNAGLNMDSMSGTDRGANPLNRQEMDV